MMTRAVGGCLLVFVISASARSERVHAQQPAPPPPASISIEDPPLIGDKDGLIYIRDPYDFIRIYPHARLTLQGHQFFGERAGTISQTVAGVDLAPRFLVREARLGLGGEALQRSGFDVGLDLVANPAIDGARVDGTDTIVALSNAWISLEAGPGLALMLGYFEAPFSLENRTATIDLPTQERNIAIRGFAVPGTGRVVGAEVGGSTPSEWLRWDVGAFGLESIWPGHFQGNGQVIGRISTRPWVAALDSAFRELQFGVSARWGARRRRDIRDDAPAITTGQGFALFRPTFQAGDEMEHMLLTGAHGAFGGELRIPVHYFVIRSEAYYVTSHTEEALSPEVRGDVQRRGWLYGWGWYAEVSAWLLHLFVPVDFSLPLFGRHPRSEHLELAVLPALVDRYGLEVALTVAGVNATYENASRRGAAAESRGRDIEVYQFGFSLNYWQTTRYRLSLGYNAYWAPASGSSANLAVVPANLGPRPIADANWLHELGARVTLQI